MDDLAIGRSVRAARLRRGWRQSDLAAAASVSRATVSRIELGELEAIQLGTIRAVCAGLLSDDRPGSTPSAFAAVHRVATRR